MVKGLTMKTDGSGLAKLVNYLAGEGSPPYGIVHEERFKGYGPQDLAISDIQIKRGVHNVSYTITVKPLVKLRHITENWLENGVSGLFFQLSREGLVGLTEYLTGEGMLVKLKMKGL